MLMPKRVKFRKNQRGKRRGISFKGSDISFGEYGLQALNNGWLTNIQIEACRVCVMRSLKGTGKLWIRAFPDKSVTIKGGEIPMGKGKGTVDHYVAIVKPGMIMFELAGIIETEAKEAMKMAGYKLPVKCKYIKK